MVQRTVQCSVQCLFMLVLYYQTSMIFNLHAILCNGVNISVISINSSIPIKVLVLVFNM